MQCACAVLYYLPYFSLLFHKCPDFRGKFLIKIKFVFWISLQHFSETFVILRRILRDTVMNVHRSSRKVPIILSECNVTSIFLTDFRKTLKYQIL
jgi:hypothetical protein